MNITDKTVALVSGGASGLGAATATALSEAGAQVVLLDRDARAGKDTATQLNAMFIETDVSDPTSVAAAIAQVQETYGALHIAVNCAGIAPAAKTVSKGAPHDPTVFVNVINVNLIGTFNLMRLAAAEMTGNQALEDGERGVIINTASVAAFDGQIGQAAYSASKAGVAGMTLPIARDLSRTGVRVNTIAPGIFETPMMMGAPDQVRLPLIDMVQFPKRLGDAPEFAALAVHMMENTYLNGETVRLDGGIRMQPK